MGAVLLFLVFWAVVFTVYLIMQPSPIDRAKQVFTKSVTWLREVVDDPGEAAGALAITGIVIAVLGFVVLYVLKLTSNLVSDFYANVATELLSIAITVLIIDRLYARRSSNEEKQRIIRQLASPSNEFALEAVRLCSEDGHEWLTDGSLQGAKLVEAHLESANLREAHLEGVNLVGANLKGAFLVGAHLKGADLLGAHLENANLFGAHLEGAFLLGAHLEGAFLVGAHLKGADLVDANLKGAGYSNNTTWPTGFVPAAAGMLNLDEMSENEKEQWHARRKQWGVQLYC